MIYMGLAFEESEFSRLNKQATAFKKAGNMDAAVGALRSAKALCGDHYADTRLAKFLQQAGLFDEAMAEVKWLLDHSQVWAQSMFGHHSASIVQCQRASWCSRVHAAADLICKRSKRPDLQAEHQQLYERYLSISNRLRSINEAPKRSP